MEDLRYPIGQFDKTIEYTAADAPAAIAYLAEYPSILREAVQGLDASTLEKVYRPGGWNIRQLVHHLADSHANLYVRLKLALTEENPAVKGYQEDLWAELSDYSLDIELPLKMLEVLHIKIVHLFREMTEADYDKTYFHSQYKTVYVLRNVVQLYEWHSKHHLEHIKIAKSNL